MVLKSLVLTERTYLVESNLGPALGGRTFGFVDSLGADSGRLFFSTLQWK